MKVKFVIILTIAATMMIFSCNTSQKAQSDKDSTEYKAVKKDYKGQRQLVDYLRTTPGVEIRGNLSDPLILIRGAKSMTGDNNPLYVVDGVIIGNSYAQAASAADRFMIENVSVLPPPRSARYGARGQSGVIEITTRKE